MRLRHSISRIILPAIGLLLVVTTGCCKKTPPPVNNDKKGITLEFYGMFEDKAITFKTGEYTRTTNEVMRISNWQMIISKLSLIRTDDTKVLLGDGYLHIDFVANKTKFHFPDAPEGSYKAISFQAGLDSAVNHGDPTAWPADHPLNGNATGLHWGWATGYVFQAMDGTYKAKASDPDWIGLTFHTATTKFIRTREMPFTFVLEPGKHKTARIEARADEFFINPNNIIFSIDGSFTHSVGTPEEALMLNMVNNGNDVFSIKEIK